MTKFTALVKTNRQRWLVLFFIALLTTKNLFNVPVGAMTIIGPVMLIRRDPWLPPRPALMTLLGSFVSRLSMLIPDLERGPWADRWFEMI